MGRKKSGAGNRKAFRENLRESKLSSRNWGILGTSLKTGTAQNGEGKTELPEYLLEGLWAPNPRESDNERRCCTFQRAPEVPLTVKKKGAQSSRTASHKTKDFTRRATEI